MKVVFDSVVFGGFGETTSLSFSDGVLSTHNGLIY